MSALLLAAAWSLVAADESTREWTSKSGETATAALIDVKDSRVRLRLSDGKVVEVPYDGLSEQDQSYLDIATHDYSAGSFALSQSVTRDLDFTLRRVVRDQMTIKRTVRREGAVKTTTTRIESASFDLQELSVESKYGPFRVSHSWSPDIEVRRGLTKPNVSMPYPGATLYTNDDLRLREVTIPKGRFVHRGKETWEVVSPQQAASIAQDLFSGKVVYDGVSEVESTLSALFIFRQLRSQSYPLPEKTEQLLKDMSSVKRKKDVAAALKKLIEAKRQAESQSERTRE